MKAIVVDYAAFESMNYEDPKYKEFQSLVQPGYIDIDELTKFFKDFNIDHSFSLYKAYVRQQIYDKDDIKKISRVVSHYMFLNNATVHKALQKRVTVVEKQEAYKAHINASNMWQLLTNAIAQPSILRGSHE